MNMRTDADLFEDDRGFTGVNRDRLRRNPNLLFWYQNLYKCQFKGIGDISEKAILEIGSGTSPLRLFHKNVITSDVLELEYVDHTFDCHRIDTFDPIPDASVDIVTLTNVLHHLKDPVTFLIKAASKLKSGGQIIFTEPYFSVVSRVVYKYLHHEPSVFNISAPVLDEINSPLSSANMAIPYLVFFKRDDWSKPLNMVFSFSRRDAIHYSALSYMITGGISRRIPIPHLLYKSIFNFDLWLARTFHEVFSSFFIMKLKKK